VANPKDRAERRCRTGTQNRPEAWLEKLRESPAPLGPKGSGRERSSTEAGLRSRRSERGGPTRQEGESPLNGGPDGAGETLRRLVGRSAPVEGRRKPLGSQALTAGRQRCRRAGGHRSPAPGSPGTGKSEEPFRGESHGHRKTSKIGGANRAIQDRRRPTITRVSGRPIRGDVGHFRGDGKPCRKRCGMTAPNVASDNGYRTGNGARIQFAFAGSGLRRNCGPEDPKGS